MRAAAPTSAASAAPLDPRLVAACDRGPEHVRARELDDGLWSLRLPLPYPRTRSVNCHLLATRDGWLLVDCGSAIGTGWAALARGLALAGIEPRAVSRLVLTHLHPDHAGLARRVLAECGCALERLDAPASANDALREITLGLDARRDGARVEGVCERDLEDMIGIALAGDGREPVPAPDRLLRSDDVLLTRSGEWRVLAGAGHSPNQLVLHDAGHARVISADTVYPEIRPFLEWGHTPDPLLEYRETLDRVERLRPSVLLPSHGRPDVDPPERLRSARLAIARAERATLAALGPGPASAYEVTCRLVGHDADPDRRQSTLSVTLCVLEHHLARGAVQARRDPDRVRRFTAQGPAAGGSRAPYAR